MDVDSLLAAYERAGSPTPADTVTSVAPSDAVTADRQQLCFQYDPYNPARAAFNGLSVRNQTTYGPMGDFELEYTWPAVYWSVATPSGMAPERIRDAVLARIDGQPPASSDQQRVDYLVSAEARAREIRLAAPTTDWWMSACTSPDFDADQALLLFIIDTDNIPAVATAVMLSQNSNLAAGLRGMPPDVQCLVNQEHQQLLGNNAANCVSSQRAPAPRITPVALPTPHIVWPTAVVPKIQFP